VQTHPIAGTRPRGKTEEEDVRLGEELKRNEKERAEHVMLVDLGRNDIGRVAKYGTVRVPTYMTLERYSHVMHLVSIVEGKLDDQHDRLDALLAENENHDKSAFGVTLKELLAPAPAAARISSRRRLTTR